MGELRLMSARKSLEILGDDELVEELKGMGAEIDAGDTRVMWNVENPIEVKAARKTWDNLVGKKGFFGYRVRKSGEPGEQIRAFDPTAGKLIIAPPMGGGR